MLCFTLFIGTILIISSRSCVAVLVLVVLRLGRDFMGFITTLNGLGSFRVNRTLRNGESLLIEDEYID